MCSQQVLKTVPNIPNVFPKTFPIVLHFLSHIDWHIAKFSSAHFQIFKLCKYTLSSFQLSKLLHWHMHIAKFTCAHCQVFRCILPSFAFASARYQFPSLKVHTLKFISTRHHISQVCSCTTFTKFAIVHCQVCRCTLLFQLFLVSKSTLPSFQIHVSRLASSHCQVFQTLKMHIASTKSIFPSWQLHIAKFPNCTSVHCQVSKFTSAHCQISKLAISSWHYLLF
jgi:hypothetical protein